MHFNGGRTYLLVGIGLIALPLAGCSDDGTADTSSTTQASETSGDGDGDGDATSGDGDGDATSGDGDGDGDATSGDGDGDGDATSGDGDGDATSGDGDGDPGGAACSMMAPCSDLEFCDYGGDCGVWGNEGVCKPRPDTCDAGGVGACGCGPFSTLNGCEQQASGDDEFVYGGCTLADEGTFACGDTHCDIATEYCSIALNDVGGENEPEYFSSCSALPDDCAQGDCDCLGVDEWGACYSGTGNSMVFSPGG